MWDGEIYGTIGPSCCDTDTIAAMLREGMTGMRLNLSHMNLEEGSGWIEAFHEAARRTHTLPELLIDMQGPELRIGALAKPQELRPGETVVLVSMGGTSDKTSDDVRSFIPVPENVAAEIEENDLILLDDGRIELRAVSGWMEKLQRADGEDDCTEGREIKCNREDVCTEGREIKCNSEDVCTDDSEIKCSSEDAETAKLRSHIICEVLRGGILTSHKSIKITGKDIKGPILTQQDLRNIRAARAFGVSALMQPFVRSGKELQEVKTALRKNDAGFLRIFAKIENREGMRNLDNILSEADMIVVARGDLGNDMPLWELPIAQKQIEKKCLAAGKPFLVVTQMLTSMIHSPVPTRAEVSDIANAVWDGAAAVMVTNETAVGEYPVEVIRYLAGTAGAAQAYMQFSPDPFSHISRLF